MNFKNKRIPKLTGLKCGVFKIEVFQDSKYKMWVVPAELDC